MATNSNGQCTPQELSATPTSQVDRNSSILTTTRSIQDFLQFKKRRIRGEQKVRTLLPRHLLNDESCHGCAETEEKLQQIKKLHKLYAGNKIQTTKYTVLSFIPKNLFEQFHRFANCYFVFIILLNFIPEIGAIQPILSMAPVIVILLLQAIKDLVEDYSRYKSDSEVNSAITLRPVDHGTDNKYHNVKWSELQVGDIVRVLCNSVIPADVLLLHTSDPKGICFIETANIDGESNLKQRTVVKRHWGHQNPNEFKPSDFRSLIECQTPNNEIYKFHGNIIPPDNSNKIPINNSNLLLRGCVIRNTDYVEGIVIYAGHETKAMLNNNGPRHKRSKLERRMNSDVIYCVVLLIIMCLIGAVGNGVWASHQNPVPQAELYIPRENSGDPLDAALSGFYMFWTMVILLQVLIPISLYVSIELVKSAQVFMINNDVDLYHAESDTPMKCRALNITEDLGQIQYVFSDKTGTLTENQMVFRRCTVGGVDYPHAANAARIENLEPTPVYINPTSDPSAHPERPFGDRDTASRHSYRRPMSGSIRPHHSQGSSTDSIESVVSEDWVRNHSAVSKQNAEMGLADGDAQANHMISRSAPNSPGMSRKSKMSTKRPAAHHRRNISSVSAREVNETIAHAPEEPDEPEEQFDDMVEEDLETDVTPDPVLFEQLTSIPNPRKGGDDAKIKLSIKKGRILDFFINLAICNTVVLSSDQEGSREAETPKVALPSPSGLYTSIASVESTPVMQRNHKAHDKNVHVHFGNGNTNNSANVDMEGEEQRFTTEELSKIRYEAESPDEAALVYAAHAYGCVLAHRSSQGGKDTVTITLPNGEGIMEFEVLHQLAFDSSRKRMSVIVRDPLTNQVTLYCKGADSAILDQLSTTTPNVNFDVNEDDSQDISNQQSNDFSIVTATKKFLDAYARTGLRTLCIAKRVLNDVEYNEWASEYMEALSSTEGRDQLIMNSFCKMETDLELLGATGIEDKLQDGVPETIESLRQAGIQVWVVTGDKQETAINIGYSCRLIHQRDEVITLNAENSDTLSELLDIHIKEQDEKRGKQPEYERQKVLNSFNISFVLPNATSYPSIDDKDLPALVLVIDGKTLAFALQKHLQKKFVRLARRCRSVLCCRATPLQKGEVVKLIRDELHVMTLAIGDGANDVSMIQVADVGIGLSGQEGMQAVMSSDYALAQFRFLRKLLLVHGHWNYARLASMVLYFFYKNAAFVFLIFWFQIFCGFSGGNMIEQMYLILFNLIFTSVPPLVNGVLDKDLSAETLMRKPSLYMQGMKDELYLQRTFWFNILDAVYQSVIIFFFLYLTYYDSDVGLIEWGTVVTSAAVFVILIHLGIETKTWTWIHWVCQIGSLLLFFAFGLIYNIVCEACSPPSNPYFVMETVIQTGEFWFSILLVTVIALFPRYVIRAVQSKVFPSESQRERIIEMARNDKSSSTASTSLAGSSTTSSSTHNNPMFQPPVTISENYPNKRPESLMKSGANFVAGSELARDALSFQYGGSTPDLSSMSPYYGAHGMNSNNSNNIPPSVGQPPDSHVYEVATSYPQPSYVNTAYLGLSDDSDCEQDSESGECTKPQSLPVSNSRMSLKYAYGGEGDLGFGEGTPAYPNVMPSSSYTHDDYAAGSSSQTSVTSHEPAGDDVTFTSSDNVKSKDIFSIPNIPV